MTETLIAVLISWVISVGGISPIDPKSDFVIHLRVPKCAAKRSKTDIILTDAKFEFDCDKEKKKKFFIDIRLNGKSVYKTKTKTNFYKILKKFQDKK